MEYLCADERILPKWKMTEYFINNCLLLWLLGMKIKTINFIIASVWNLKLHSTFNYLFIELLFSFLFMSSFKSLLTEFDYKLMSTFIPLNSHIFSTFYHTLFYTLINIRGSGWGVQCLAQGHFSIQQSSGLNLLLSLTIQSQLQNLGGNSELWSQVVLQLLNPEPNSKGHCHHMTPWYQNHLHCKNMERRAVTFGVLLYKVVKIAVFFNSLSQTILYGSEDFSSFLALVKVKIWKNLKRSDSLIYYLLFIYLYISPS